MNFSNTIFEVMSKTLNKNKNSFIIGQGVNDQRGIFGTTKDLYKKFPNRVIETPLSEDAISGICLGAALAGNYPINTHIRNDFSLLIFNQLINLIAKYKYIYDGNFKAPMLFRMIIGRSWGQGAQHSQSLQSLMSHIPGLTVIMPSHPQTLKETYLYAINKFNGPVISLEHRLLYSLNFKKIKPLEKKLKKNPFRSFKIQNGSSVTIVASSIMVVEAIRISNILKKYNLTVDLIDLNCISNIDHKIIIKSVKKTGKLVILDTSWKNFGTSSEICRMICEHDSKVLKKPVMIFANKFTPCPTSKKLEDFFYPNTNDILKGILKLVGIKKNISLDNISQTEFYKEFKGPF